MHVDKIEGLILLISSILVSICYVVWICTEKPSKKTIKHIDVRR